MSVLNSNTRNVFVAILIVVIQQVAVAQTTAPSPITAGTLRCEYLHDPVGLDETAPRLSWELHSSRRGEHQTRYQLLVASSTENLSKDNGDLWDSGEVASSQTAQIVYAGKPLTSRTICFWKVRAWDRDARPGPWSDAARWEMGLLDPHDWSAGWIEPTPAGEPVAAFHILHANFEAIDGSPAKDVTELLTKKIAHGFLHITANKRTLGGDPAPNQSKQLRIDYENGGVKQTKVFGEGARVTLPDPPIAYLRKSFSTEKPIRQARLYATALGLYEIFLNGTRVGDHVLAPDWTDYDKRVEYQAYDVTAQLKPGDNAIGAMLANGWYAGEIGNGGFQRYGTEPALLAQLEITYTDGTVARIVTDHTWKLHPGPILSSDFMQGEQYDARQEIAGWDQPGLSDADWKGVNVRDESNRHLVAQVSESPRAAISWWALDRTATGNSHRQRLIICMRPARGSTPTAKASTRRAPGRAICGRKAKTFASRGPKTTKQSTPSH